MVTCGRGMSDKKKKKILNIFRSASYRPAQSCTSRTRSTGPGAVWWSPVAGPWLKSASSVVRRRQRRWCSPESGQECLTAGRLARLLGGGGDVCNMAVDGDRVRRRRRWRRLPSRVVGWIRRRRDGIPLPPPSPVRSGVHVVRAARNAPPLPSLPSTVAACFAVCLQPLHPLSPPAEHTSGKRE